jgi:alkylresorcinol/alkylpyrone synthase
MTTLRSLSTEHPHLSIDAAESTTLLAALGGGHPDHWRDEVARSGVRRRSVALPPERLAALGGVGERNALYAQLAPGVAERTARAALARAGATAADVAAVLVASSTGHLVPTLDHHLAARLGVSPAARRLALNDLGCVGALRAAALAADLVRAQGVALVVAVELGSLWLPAGEASPADVRAAMTVGDGAGAIVLDAAPGAAGPQILASRSIVWPGTLEARGAVQTGAGLRHVVSPRLPRAVVAHLRRTVGDFLAAHGLTLADVARVAVNPSELDLARAMIAHLDLAPSVAELPRHVWERHGNTLAAGPLHLLDALAQHGTPGDGDLVLLVAIGPGLTCELMLLHWHPLPVQ